MVRSILFQQRGSQRFVVTRAAVVRKINPQLVAVASKGVERRIALPIRLIGREGLPPELRKRVCGRLMSEFNGFGPPEDGIRRILFHPLSALIGVAQKELSL